MNRIVIGLCMLGFALVSAQSGEEEEIIALPISFELEWPGAGALNDSEGIVRLALDNIFLDPNGAMSPPGTEPITKPAEGTFVIAVNPSDNCAEVTVTQDWVMTLKDVSDVEGASPNVLYFVQEGTDWFSNEAGFLFAFDGETCLDREFSAEVIINGPFVQAIVDAPNADDPNVDEES